MAEQTVPKRTRKHTATHWIGANSSTLRCKCGEWEASGKSERDLREQHRAHRVEMGEWVKPRKDGPDWADLREMARNAGWTRRTLARDWFVWDDKESFVHIRRHPLGFLKISLGGGFGDVALNDPTPARVLNIARELGIGGTS